LIDGAGGNWPTWSRAGTAQDDLARPERDTRDLYNGTGRWAGHPAGQAALATREAAADYHRAQERPESTGAAGERPAWQQHFEREQQRQLHRERSHGYEAQHL